MRDTRRRNGKESRSHYLFTERKRLGKMKGVLLAFLNVLLILFTVLVHKIIFRVLGLGYDSLVLYWGLFVLIFFIFDVILNSLFIKNA